MADLFAKNIDCVLCEETFSPVIEPAEDETSYRLNCCMCANWLTVSITNPVYVTLRRVLELKGEALALAFQTVVANCPCSGEFNHDAGKRCPVCIDKIEAETRGSLKKLTDFVCPWNIEELTKLEPKVYEYILTQMDTKVDTLATLIEKFEAGEIDAETYMQAIEDLQYRESRQIAVIQTWAMILGPEMAYRAAEENDLVERYGTRILVKIAEALAISTGSSVLASLSKEKDNLSGDAQKELSTFLAKIGGGF
jgi:hypothetical protein